MPSPSSKFKKGIPYNLNYSLLCPINSYSNIGKKQQYDYLFFIFVWFMSVIFIYIFSYFGKTLLSQCILFFSICIIILHDKRERNVCETCCTEVKCVWRPLEIWCSHWQCSAGVGVSGSWGARKCLDNLLFTFDVRLLMKYRTVPIHVLWSALCPDKQWCNMLVSYD